MKSSRRSTVSAPRMRASSARLQRLKRLAPLALLLEQAAAALDES